MGLEIPLFKGIPVGGHPNPMLEEKRPKLPNLAEKIAEKFSGNGGQSGANTPASTPPPTPPSYLDNELMRHKVSDQ